MGSRVALGIEVSGGKQTDEAPPGLRRQGSSEECIPWQVKVEGLGRVVAVPRIPAPNSFTPLPQGAEPLLGPESSRQKGGFPHLSASSRRRPCLGSCGPVPRPEAPAGVAGAVLPPARSAVLAASRLQCSALPPASRPSQAFPVCYSSLYVASSLQEEFSFLPPAPQRPLSFGNLPVELA